MYPWGGSLGLEDPFPRWLPPMAGKLVLAVPSSCRLSLLRRVTCLLPAQWLGSKSKFQEKGSRAVTSSKSQSGKSLSATSAVRCCSGSPEPIQGQGERTQTLPLSEGGGKEFLTSSNLPLCVTRAGKGFLGRLLHPSLLMLPSSSFSCTSGGILGLDRLACNQEVTSP